MSTGDKDKFSPWLRINNGAVRVSFELLEDLSFGAQSIRVMDSSGFEGQLMINTDHFYPAIMWWKSRHRDQSLKCHIVTFVDTREKHGRGCRIE